MRFELTVTDTDGNKATDEVQITTLEDAAHAVFVSGTLGNDINDGSMVKPVRSLDKAISLATRVTSRQSDVYVHEGDYRLTQTLSMANGVSLYGDFETSCVEHRLWRLDAHGNQQNQPHRAGHGGKCY